MRSTLMAVTGSRRILLVSAVLLAGVTAAVAAMAQTASATVTTLATFTTPGIYAWKVPSGVTSATFDVYGAGGGNIITVNHNVVTVYGHGGAGGEAKAKLGVKAGEVFEIAVGGQGGAATVGTFGGSGGFNGGGAGRPGFPDARRRRRWRIGCPDRRAGRCLRCHNLLQPA